MKKYIAQVLFPYLAILDIHIWMDTSSERPKFFSFLLLAVNLIELFFVTKSLISTWKMSFGNNSTSECMKNIVYVKLLHIPAYVYIFAFGFAMFCLPLGFIISIFCFFVDSWTIFITGLSMTIALVAKYKQKEVSGKFALVHSILAFVFCLDIIDGLYLRFKILKKR